MPGPSLFASRAEPETLNEPIEHLSSSYKPCSYSVSTQFNQDNIFQIYHPAKIYISSDQITVPKRLDVIVPCQKHGELLEKTKQPLGFCFDGEAKH